MIEIYRFGRYINKVNGDIDLMAWLRKNVAPINENHDLIPDSTCDQEVMMIAKAREFTFKRIKQVK